MEWIKARRLDWMMGSGWVQWEVIRIHLWRVILCQAYLPPDSDYCLGGEASLCVFPIQCHHQMLDQWNCLILNWTSKPMSQISFLASGVSFVRYFSSSYTVLTNSRSNTRWQILRKKFWKTQGSPLPMFSYYNCAFWEVSLWHNEGSANGTCIFTGRKILYGEIKYLNKSKYERCLITTRNFIPW